MLLRQILKTQRYSRCAMAMPIYFRQTMIFHQHEQRKQLITRELFQRPKIVHCSFDVTVVKATSLTTHVWHVMKAMRSQVQLPKGVTSWVTPLPGLSKQHSSDPLTLAFTKLRGFCKYQPSGSKYAMRQNSSFPPAKMGWTCSQNIWVASCDFQWSWFWMATTPPVMWVNMIRIRHGMNIIWF